MPFRTDDVNTNTLARFPVDIENAAIEFAPADTTTAKSLIAGGTYGKRIHILAVSSTDTVNRNIALRLNNGTTTFDPFAIITVPLGTATNGSANGFNLLSHGSLANIVQVDNNGNPYIQIAPGWSLFANATTTITAATKITVNVFASTY